MTDVAIVYFSASGATRRLAETIAEGAGENARTSLHEIRGSAIVDGRFRDEALLAALDGADAILFGSPTFMGGAAAEFKAFADATSDRWTVRRWADKLAGGFTCGGCLNGDQSHTLNYFSILAAQHGMLWCNLDIPSGEDAMGRNRLGSQCGVVAHIVDTVVDDRDLQTARYLGQRVARLTSRFGG